VRGETCTADAPAAYLWWGYQTRRPSTRRIDRSRHAMVRDAPAMSGIPKVSRRGPDGPPGFIGPPGPEWTDHGFAVRDAVPRRDSRLPGS
jgi:hypothetical protein